MQASCKEHAKNDPYNSEENTTLKKGSIKTNFTAITVPYLTWWRI